jgi:hypothetical protein
MLASVLCEQQRWIPRQGADTGLQESAGVKEASVQWLACFAVAQPFPSCGDLPQPGVCSVLQFCVCCSTCTLLRHACRFCVD